MAQKRRLSVSPPPTALPAQNYAKSNIIQDRASSFIAAYSPSLSRKALQSLADFRSASHRIAAWRLLSKQTTLTGDQRYETGHDDDGENWAGKKLEAVLESEGVTGSVVVARWYGGVLLGPVRFRWIEECAKEAIGRWKRGLCSDIGEVGHTTEDHSAKKARVEQSDGYKEDDKSRAEIIEELRRRDDNITVLRNLLREKQDKLEGTVSPVTSPSKSADYSTMPLPRLQALDKARDASVAYILKQLDKVDQKQREENELDAAFEVAAMKEDERLDEEAFAEMEKQLEEEDELSTHILPQGKSQKSSNPNT